MREEMMDNIGIPTNIQSAIMANHEPNEKGVYPDFGLQIPRSQNCKYTDYFFEIHRNAAIHWFQNGHPMKPG